MLHLIEWFVFVRKGLLFVVGWLACFCCFDLYFLCFSEVVCWCGVVWRVLFVLVRRVFVRVVYGHFGKC